MKIRTQFKEMKKAFLDRKWNENLCTLLEIANIIFISIISYLICFISLVFILFGLNIVSYIIMIVTLLAFFFFSFNSRAFKKILPLSAKVLFRLFGRYGSVVMREDWKNIKKYCHKLYKDALSKSSYGYCYFYSWGIALYLTDAQIMYCSIDSKDGPTGHAVIVKNNCVYDTNLRQHFDLEVFKETLNCKIYKLFSEEDYRDVNFFDNIRKGFVDWCAENNVYCDCE